MPNSSLMASTMSVMWVFHSAFRNESLDGSICQTADVRIDDRRLAAAVRSLSRRCDNPFGIRRRDRRADRHRRLLRPVLAVPQIAGRRKPGHSPSSQEFLERLQSIGHDATLILKCGANSIPS